MDTATIRENITDAIKFWEPARIIYNIVLAVIVVVHFISQYKAAKTQMSLDFALGLFLLAVIANVAYCAAYLVDLFAQSSGFRDTWRSYRWMLFGVGTLFAAVITHFISSGMFPSAMN